MAWLYPSSIEQIESIPDSEKRLFERFKNLDDSYHIFHSLTWSDRIDGECDFVIFNELKGFIALEVKSGKMEFDGKRWSTIESDGKFQYIKDPVKQAQDSVRAIRKVYEEKFNSSLQGIYTWGVCFSDCNRGSGFRTLDISDANILDFCDSDNISGWVGNLFRVNEDFHGVKILSDTERANFVSLFNRDLHIPFSVRKVIVERQRKLASADLMQEYLLDLFEDKSRVAFHGAAGTGKTWIAMKKAVRLAASGKKVLYLCNSRYNCETIALKLEPYSNIDVFTFHSFSNTVIRIYITTEIKRFGCEEAFFNCITDLLSEGRCNSLTAKRKYSGGRNLELRVHGALFSLSALNPDENYDTVLAYYEDRLPIDIIDILSLLMPDGSGNDNFYNERMSVALAQVFENEHRCLDKFTYDAVIIDEGQDFHKNWCDSLKNLFEKYKNRTVYVFYDDNQTILRRQKELPIRELISRSDHNNYIFRLRDNIRNTSDIHRFAIEKTGLASNTRSLEIQGVIPVEKEYNSREESITYTASLINELIHKHNVERNSIVILSNRSIDNSIFSDEKNAGDYSIVTSITADSENSILFRTIHEYKGLESDVVILILHKGESEFADKSRYLSEELLYVGFTRARYLLYVVTVMP